MTRRTPLENPKAELADLINQGWYLSDDETRISKQYKFKSFKSAMAWMRVKLIMWVLKA